TLPPVSASTIFPYTTLFRSRSHVLHLVDAVRDERLAAEARVDRHDEHVIEIASDVFERDRGRGWIEHRARPRAQLLDQMDRAMRSEEHTSELQSRENLVCRL